MIKFNTRLATAVATAAVILGAVAPAAFADTGVIIDGNGENSTSTVAINNTTGTKVVQVNNSTVVTSVNSTASTGKNTANGNTGGSTSITTGNATSNVHVSVGGSSNTAVITPDCGCNTTTSVAITGNAEDSSNGVVILTKNWFKAIQKNFSTILTDVSSIGKTGHNTSSSNTGGTTNITTGMGTSNVTVDVTGSTNTLSH